MNISILIHKHASLSMASLIKDILERALILDGNGDESVHFVTADGNTVEVDGITVNPSGKVSSTDILITPPFNRRFTFDLSLYKREVDMISDLPGSIIKVSSCMGALLLAEARVLDHKKATTHWKAADLVSKSYPFVEWDLSQIICESNEVITAGGYLATTDLALYLVTKICSPSIAHQLGSYLLIDSIRQKQSVYAVELAMSPGESEFKKMVGHWIEVNIRNEIFIKDLATKFHMSERGFYRGFFKAFGMTPNKFIQLKRIEKAKALLKNTNKNIEYILGEIGLVDLASFRRLFLREMGMTPYEYRRRVTF